MPASSEKQKKFFEVVRGTQEGKVKNPSEKAKEVAKSVSKKAAEDFAKDKIKKPKK